MSQVVHLYWTPTSAGLPEDRQTVTWMSPSGEQIDGIFMLIRGLPAWIFVNRKCSPERTDYTPSAWRPRTQEEVSC